MINLFNRAKATKKLLCDEYGELKPEALELLADLENFCRFSKSTAHVGLKFGQVDPLAMAIAEGRREVFLRILNQLNLNQQELLRLSKNLKEHQKETNL